MPADESDTVTRTVRKGVPRRAKGITGLREVWGKTSVVIQVVMDGTSVLAGFFYRVGYSVRLACLFQFRGPWLISIGPVLPWESRIQARSLSTLVVRALDISVGDSFLRHAPTRDKAKFGQSGQDG